MKTVRPYESIHEYLTAKKHEGETFSEGVERVTDGPVVARPDGTRH